MNKAAIGMGFAATLSVNPAVQTTYTTTVSYHRAADVQDFDTLDILGDPRLTADLRAGLEDIDEGRLTSFEDVFGKPL